MLQRPKTQHHTCCSYLETLSCKQIYTIWNYRREALQPILAAGGEAAQAACTAELALTQACLQENPKSYSTWHHRKWLVLHGLADPSKELKLVGRCVASLLLQPSISFECCVPCIAY
eukprot:GHRQ01032818.1.p1 GENE.GHRQ01032818.1~~GHRQ01032818.1.p1  ORF type:complete len:117 (-),score=25.86 GHRQ01032818.1:107-457(-)